ncbi:Aste57867_8667 [Aphanomyces stellatus]|uniref:Aste57867_8667 protein n=1 Tax=Aphanomyces stellatus TaxID=120398 RepID=A0A485KL87_9STRA|nr:hypothetical protein As57867_008633 [Aphanomyces stellatus]VFT85553.1 Aste57867_8667 [Aphanomyces stellatus]
MSRAPIFVQRLYFMLEKSGSTDLVSWSADGLSFLIHEPTLFSKRLLPKFYGHGKLATFVRDLSHFGFHKVTQLPHRLDVIEYCHIDFQRGNVKALRRIQKRMKQNLDTKQRQVVDEIEDIIVNIKRQLASEQTRNRDMADYLSCVMDDPLPQLPSPPMSAPLFDCVEPMQLTNHPVPACPEWSDCWLEVADLLAPQPDMLCMC